MYLVSFIDEYVSYVHNPILQTIVVRYPQGRSQNLSCDLSA